MSLSLSDVLIQRRSRRYSKYTLYTN